MICAEPKESTARLRDRQVVARERAQLAHAALSACHLCPQDCGVNRLADKRGWCRAGATGRVFSAQVEVGDELELIPTFAIAFSGCDMRCAFCITGADSWNPQRGEPFDATALAAKAAAALQAGARTVMILGGEPTIHLPEAIRFVAVLPSSTRLVWKTNAYISVEARAWLEGLFDVWVADYKFGNDRCAERLAAIRDYQRHVQDTLFWANQTSELIIRHLLMPGHVDCCWEPVARWIATELPAIKVSLRCGFWPAWKAGQYPELQRTVRTAEEKHAVEIASNYRLHLVE
jgi:putative pyruvate formate lyase activating enzyme